MTKNSLRGFTLFELLTVIAIVAILSTIAYPVFIGVLERGKALKDMNNLRQIGVVTQLYLNDHENVLFSPATSWMSQLYQKDGSKYLSSWDVFLSPFDNPVLPRTGSDSDTNSAISYGINGVLPSIIGMSATKITIPTAFILFAPAEASGATVTFQGTANTTSQPDPASLAASPNITVVGIGDMSGDVFGNGMLLSEHIRLVAAFDHRHIFLDPDGHPWEVAHNPYWTIAADGSDATSQIGSPFTPSATGAHPATL